MQPSRQLFRIVALLGGLLSLLVPLTGCFGPQVVRTVHTEYNMNQVATQLAPSGFAGEMVEPLDAGQASLGGGGVYTPVIPTPTTANEELGHRLVAPQAVARGALGFAKNAEIGGGFHIGPGSEAVAVWDVEDTPEARFGATWKAMLDVRACLVCGDGGGLSYVGGLGLSAVGVTRDVLEVATESTYGSSAVLYTDERHTNEFEFRGGLMTGLYGYGTIPKTNYQVSAGVLFQSLPMYRQSYTQSRTCDTYSDGREDCTGKIHRNPKRQFSAMTTPAVGASAALGSGVSLHAQGYAHLGKTASVHPFGGMVTLRRTFGA